LWWFIFELLKFNEEELVEYDELDVMEEGEVEAVGEEGAGI
jgi:hypothetical protein